MVNKKKPCCAVCGETTYHVVWRKSGGEDMLVGFYCRDCRMLYPLKGIKPGLRPLYLGLRQVSQ